MTIISNRSMCGRGQYAGIIESFCNSNNAIQQFNIEIWNREEAFLNCIILATVVSM